MVAMSDGTKMCRCCWLDKPVEEFRRRVRGGGARLNQCRTCHRKAEQRRRAAKRAKLDGKAIDAFAGAGKRALNQGDVAAALGSVYGQFGGRDGFVGAFWTQYEQAPPGSYRRTKMLEAVLNLTQLDSARRDAEKAAREGEMDLITDEELDAHVDDLVTRKIASDPQLAIDTAARLGWTVIPPDDAE